MNRLLHERNSARDQGDALARAVLENLGGRPADFKKALIDYYNNGGPCWALPPGEWMITRYDYQDAVTKPLAVFQTKEDADQELERLKKLEAEDKASGKCSRSNFFCITRKNT